MIETTAEGTRSSTSEKLDFYELEKKSRIQLQSGSAEAANWFETTHDRLLNSAVGIDIGEHVETLLLFVQWYIKEGQYGIALKMASKAVTICRSARRPALLRRALNLTGVANARIGNFTQAVIDCVEGLEIADEIGDRTGKAAILANLSAFRFEMGLISESIHLNRYVVELTTGEPHLAELTCSAHHNIAAAALVLNDDNSAIEEIECAIRLAPDPANQFWIHNRLVFEVTHCKVLLKLGRVMEARRHVLIAENLASRLDSRPAQLRAWIARSLCDAAEGAPACGLERVKLMQEWVTPEDPAFRDLLEAAAYCSDCAGCISDADRMREKLLAHLATFQRKSAIRQIAAFQRTIRALGTARDEDLLDLPADARKSAICGWTVSARTTQLLQRLEALASLADQRENEGASGHSFRVGKLVELIAQERGYEKQQAAIIGLAARLHDLGKLATPDALLLKHGQLSAIELNILRRHTVEGSQMLADILATMERWNAPVDEIESVRMACQIALHHHEWWNGCGYPHQLAGTAIPEAARITAIADVFEDMTCYKPYHAQLGVDQALKRIKESSGEQFDPVLCDALSRLVSSSQTVRILEAMAGQEDELSAYRRANNVIDRIVDSAKRTHRQPVGAERARGLTLPLQNS
jgi:HD-GYP domain-containing protein (c-di-GMP phosphodiesterase class II)